MRPQASASSGVPGRSFTSIVVLLRSGAAWHPADGFRSAGQADLVAELEMATADHDGVDTEAGCGPEALDRDGDEVVLQGDTEGVGVGHQVAVAQRGDGAAGTRDEHVEDHLVAQVEPPAGP